MGTHQIAKALEGLAVPLEDLVLDAENARVHTDRQVEEIASSLAEFGQDQPVVVQKKGMVVRKGNGRVLAARKLGWTHVAAVVVDESRARAVARAISDNRTSDLSEWDDGVLARLLADDSVSALPTGFSSDEIERRLVESLQSEAGGNDPGPQSVEVKRGTAVGTAWRLGDHRLVCGDSTIPDVVERALGSGKARMAFTDPPPYNIAYDGGGKGGSRRAIANDSMGGDAWRTFVEAFGQRLKESVAGDCYVWGASGPRGMAMRLWLVEMGLHWSGTIEWVKDRPTLTRSNFHGMHEPCIYGWFGSKSSYTGSRKGSDVWRVPRPARSADHPTMKPTELVVRALRSSSRRGDRVLDLFTGGGSTLVGCEQTGRLFSGVELDPGYVESTVRRWERMTGRKAEKEE